MGERTPALHTFPHKKHQKQKVLSKLLTKIRHYVMFKMIVRSPVLA